MEVNYNEEKDIRISKRIEAIAYIFIVLYLIFYNYFNIHQNNKELFILNNILAVIFIIIILSINHIAKIKLLSKKIFTEVILLTLWIFIEILFFTTKNSPIFFILPILIITTVMSYDNIKNVIIYISLLTLGLISLFFIPYYNSSNEISLTIIKFWIIFFITTASFSYLYVYRQMTEKYQEEKELAKHNEALTKEKNSFVRILSTELKDPIKNTEMQLQEILDKNKYVFNPNMKDILEKTLTNAKTLDNLSQNILTMDNSNIDSITFALQKIDLGSMLSEVLNTLDLKAKERNISIVSSDIKNIYVNADYNRLGEILRNVVDNAIKYTDEGGNVSIFVSKEDGNIYIKVQDTGIGIPADDIDKLFTKFYRASNVEKNTKQGTGLGLYLVKQYIEKMNGEIKIESVLGKGTTITLIIPQYGD
ncbi:MAG: sensor histidine kinase [Patescibacteria group bacterium]